MEAFYRRLSFFIPVSIILSLSILSISNLCFCSNEKVDIHKQDVLSNELPNDNHDLSNRKELSDHLLIKSVKFYQKYFSSIFGGHCSLNPSCSRYSLAAYEEHGAILGFLLTYDRLIHEGDEPKFSYKILVEGKIRNFDPLKNNDFWFKKRNDEPWRRLILNVEKLD
jgi:hypothetical protein